jgi:ferrous iron transport protein A
MTSSPWNSLIVAIMPKWLAFAAIPLSCTVWRSWVFGQVAGYESCSQVVHACSISAGNVCACVATVTRKSWFAQSPSTILPREVRMPSLDQIERGARTVVTAVRGDDGIMQRLLEMGLVEGEEIEVLGFAPMGDPIEIRLRDYRLSLRRAEAARVIVEPVAKIGTSADL